MIPSVGSSLSALQAYGKKMESIADNVANSESEGFKKSRVTLKEAADGGVQVDLDRIESEGDIVYESDGDGEMVQKELSNVDLAEEIPQSVLAQRSYEASLKMIEAEDETLGSLLDIIG